jgi:DNA-directed RNA polymerase subunit K/omega
MSNFLDLVEEFPKHPEYTQFEKIIITAKRAKALHNEDKAPSFLSDHTAPYLALQELKEDRVRLVYREAPAAALIESEEDVEESEEE